MAFFSHTMLNANKQSKDLIDSIWELPYPTEFPPTKTLIHHIRRRDWEGARFRILTYPWDAFYKTRGGNSSTPLHLVCLYRAPLDIVELLLNANPSALLLQDSEGWTPIHVVLLYGGDEDIALLLIRRGGAAAASLQSRFVGSPLHLACRHESSIAVLKELLCANLVMATTANETDTKPAAFIWNQFARNPRNAQVMQELRQGLDHNNEGLDIKDERVEGLVKRVSLMLQAAKHEDLEGTSVLVHDLVAYQSELGDMSPFLNLAIRLFPEQVEYLDHHGNCPLHMAASSPPATKPLNSYRFMDPAAKDPVDVLVQAYPAAARIRNRQGQVPIQLALTKGRRTWETGIASLVQAESDVLLFRDQQTLLYPFQLAAAYPAKDEIESLGTILELLLACPHALQ